MKMHQKLPNLIRLLCWQYDNAFIVGGSIDYLISNTKILPKDFDIIIHPNNFRDVMMLLKTYPNVSTNSFGGFKVIEDNMVIDIWPDTIDRLVATFNKSFYALQPKLGKLIKVTDDL